MAQKTKSETEMLAFKLRHLDTSWERQEKAVYTVDALEKEIQSKLSPKKEQSRKKPSD